MQSCRTIHKTLQAEQSALYQKSDSVSVLLEREVKPVVIRQDQVKLAIPIVNLKTLPVGASWRGEKGRSSGTVLRVSPDTVVFIANCDSLTLLVENLRSEVYRGSMENEMLRDVVRETKDIVLREPSPWQWFQIWLGRTFIGIIILTLIKKTSLYGKFSEKIAGLLQKVSGK